MPRDFAQWVQRVPIERSRLREDENEDKPRPRRPAWPEAEPDYIIHKDKNGFPIHQPKKHRNPTPRQRLARGSLQYWGWRFLCPSCATPVKRLYLPLFRCVIPEIASAFPASSGDDPDDLPRLPMTLACFKCHRIKGYTRIGAAGWNELVSYLSAGLLYGRDVKPPTWFHEVQRQRAAPRHKKRPAPRRQLVLEMLLARRTYPQIAHALGNISNKGVWRHVSQIYRHHNVHSREALIRKLSPKDARDLTPQQSRRKKMLPLIRAGLTIRELAARLKVSDHTICTDLQKIYRAHKVTRRADLLALLIKKRPPQAVSA